MDAVARLHGLPGPFLAGALALLGLAAAALAVTGRPPAAWLNGARIVLLGVIVAMAALGLVLSLRGSAPAEWIHWVYGGLIVAALLAPGLRWADDSPRARCVSLAIGSLLAAVFAWRLWGSG